MKRIIVDVDAGADDSVALFLLLHADKVGKIKLEFITCTAGNTTVDHVVDNVVRLLETAGRTDIPVYKGASGQLIPGYFVPDHYHGLDGFADLQHETAPNVDIVRDEHASIVIGRYLKKYPGEVTVMALGPLTTIALAVELYADFSQNVQELAIMGGNNRAVGNTPNAAEFNFFYDPESAFIVLEKCVCPIVILPWETCLLPEIPLDWRYNTLGAIDNPVLKLIERAERKISAKNTVWRSCDGFMAAAFLYPACIKRQESFHGTVELHGKRTRGQLVLDHRNKRFSDYRPNVTIIEELCATTLMKIFLDAAKDF